MAIHHIQEQKKFMSQFPDFHSTNSEFQKCWSIPEKSVKIMQNRKEISFQKMGIQEKNFKNIWKRSGIFLNEYQVVQSPSQA